MAQRVRQAQLQGKLSFAFLSSGRGSGKHGGAEPFPILVRAAGDDTLPAMRHSPVLALMILLACTNANPGAEEYPLLWDRHDAELQQFLEERSAAGR